MKDIKNRTYDFVISYTYVQMSKNMLKRTEK